MDLGEIFEDSWYPKGFPHYHDEEIHENKFNLHEELLTMIRDDSKIRFPIRKPMVRKNGDERDAYIYDTWDTHIQYAFIDDDCEYAFIDDSETIDEMDMIHMDEWDIV